MAFGLNSAKNTSILATTPTKAGSFKQHLKRWMGWRRKRSQQTAPSIQYNNYLMLSSITDESIHHDDTSCSPLIPNDDQSIMTKSTDQFQQKPYDEGLARLSSYTADSSHLDYTVPAGSCSSNKAASIKNYRRPALIDTISVRPKIIDPSTYNRLTGPLTTSAFSDLTNSMETSHISPTSAQRSSSWDPELQQDRDASLIESGLSTLSNSLSNTEFCASANGLLCTDDDTQQLESDLISDSENDVSGNDPLCSLDRRATSPHQDGNDDSLAQNSTPLMMQRDSICSWAATVHDNTHETVAPTWGSTSASTFFTSSASPTSIKNNSYLTTYDAAYDYSEGPPLDSAAKMNDPGSTTSFFTTTSSFTQQDMEDDGTDATRSSLSAGVEPAARSLLDRDTVLLVTHAVNFLKSREDSSWDNEDSDDRNNVWPCTQTPLDASPTIATSSSSTKTRHADITPSPSTSTASTLVPSGSRKMTLLLQDKNIHAMPNRKETTDEEIHRIVSTHVLF